MNNLDLIGKPVNMKVENFLDKMCQRVAAALFIQKMYRGYKVRLKVIDNRMIKAKKLAAKNKATRVICELIQQFIERANQTNPC